MKVSTLRPNKFTALYMPFENAFDPNQPDVTYKNYKTPISINCDVQTNAVGELTLFTELQLMNDALISRVAVKDLKRVNSYGAYDAQGLIYKVGVPSTGAVWRIIESQPLLDIFGNKNRYRYRCLMIIPSNGSVTAEPPTYATSASNWQSGVNPL
jgi:hypothetical protein